MNLKYISDIAILKEKIKEHIEKLNILKNLLQALADNLQNKK